VTSWVEVAAHLNDHVLPPLPIRQWVLSVPKRIRPFFHHHPRPRRRHPPPSRPAPHSATTLSRKGSAPAAFDLDGDSVRPIPEQDPVPAVDFDQAPPFDPAAPEPDLDQTRGA
jgi:hypothetical protein